MLGQFKSPRAPATFPDGTVSAGRAGGRARQARGAYRSLVIIVKVVGMTQDRSGETSYWLRNGVYDDRVSNTTSHRNTCEAAQHTQATTLHVVLVTAAGFLVEHDALLPRQQQDTECRDGHSMALLDEQGRRDEKPLLRTGCGNKPSARC
ncbi:hypothetical protein HYE67_003283 [Fusarium culmorum]|uniref:Uncharacterized protein n=1 Tax=Fusarium culmorum TaxID=5516 RepID=A0A2T4GJA6_FUSCU|nr:hypothetical protein FCULG_00000414 [Fusarium culmorum]QPC61052.1 hypothetical protein HYE67_003283 [Fusarium culmorum]